MSYANLKTVDGTKFSTLATITVGARPLEELLADLVFHHIEVWEENALPMAKSLTFATNPRQVELVELSWQQLGIKHNRVDLITAMSHAARFGFKPCSAADGFEIAAWLALNKPLVANEISFCYVGMEHVDVVDAHIQKAVSEIFMYEQQGHAEESDFHNEFGRHIRGTFYHDYVADHGSWVFVRT